MQHYCQLLHEFALPDKNSDLTSLLSNHVSRSVEGQDKCPVAPDPCPNAGPQHQNGACVHAKHNTLLGVGVMLAQRYRRWANIKTTPRNRLVLSVT